MGQKDIAEKYLENYNDVFADIINVLLAKGKQLIRPEELENVKEQTHYKTGDGELHEQERDVSKYWKKRKVRLSLYGLENETGIDSYMPFRTIGYDGASYREQLLEDEEDEKSSQTQPDGPKSRKKKNLVPVVTIILYFGEKHWRHPNSIRDMVNIPPELEQYFNDYKMMLRSKAPNYDAYGLFRALHSHNPTQYSHIVGLASHFYAHIGAGPKVFQPLMSELMWF